MADYLGMGEQTSFPTQYLAQQQGMAELANKRANTQHQLATTDYLGAMSREANVRANTAEMELDANKKIAELAGIATQDQDGQPLDPVAQLNTIAQLYTKAGLVKKGIDVLKTSAGITAQLALAGARDTKASVDQQKANTAMVEKYTKMLGNVSDAEGWETIKASILQDEGGNPNIQNWISKLGDYTPEKAASLQSAITSYKDKAWAANARARTEIYDRIKTADEKNKETKTAISEQRLQVAKDREARLAKESGDRAAGRGGEASKAPVAAGMPTKAEVSMAEDQLKALNVQGDVTDHQEIAQQAKIRWKANPGLTPAEATAQVIQERVKSGDITPGKTEPKYFGLSEKKVPGQMYSRNRPAALPTKIEDAVVGQYYQTPRGVHKYLGDDKFEPVK